MDPSSSTPVLAQTPPSPPPGEPIFDPMEQNQNDGTTSPVGGVQTTTSSPQPQPFQPRGQQSTPQCCCCEPRVCLGVFACFDLAVELFVLYVFANQSLYYLHGCRHDKINCVAFSVAVLFFLALTLTSSIVLLTSTCMMKKTWSVVSHVVGWIPILSAVIYTYIFMHYDTDRIFDNGGFVLVSTIVGFLWRICESFVVYRYWKEIPGQYASRNQGQAKNMSAYGQTNYEYATRGYGNGYTPSNYGYAQPGGYNYDAVGYGGFGQPGYGGYAGYGGFGQPVGSYSHV